VLTLGQTIRRGVRWTLFGNVGNQVLQFAFGVVLARLLTPADFGKLVTVQIFTGVASMVAAGGMGQALIQAKTTEPRDFHVVFTLQLAVCTLICLFFFAIAPWFADWYRDPLYANLLRASALTFLLRPFNNVPGSKLRREMRFKAIAIVSVANLCVGSASSIAMALAGWGVWSLVVGGYVGSLVSIAMLIVASGWRPGFAYRRESAQRLGLYGFKVSANDIAVYLRSQASNFIISRSLGASGVGLFNKADSLSQVPVQVSFSTYHVVLRALASVQDNPDKSKYLYLRAVTLVTAYAYPLLLGLCWAAEPFVRVAYGSQWLHSVPPLQVLALAGLLVCLENQSGAVTAARDRLGTELVIQIGAIGVAALGCLAAVGYGLTAVAWALFGASAYSCVALVLLACRILRVRAREIARALGPAGALSAIVVATMAAADAAGLDAIRATHPLGYLAALTTAAGAAYALGFLFLPLEQLRMEAQRWKNLLVSGDERS